MKSHAAGDLKALAMNMKSKVRTQRDKDRTPDPGRDRAGATVKDGRRLNRSSSLDETDHLWREHRMGCSLSPPFISISLF